MIVEAEEQMLEAELVLILCYLLWLLLGCRGRLLKLRRADSIVILNQIRLR